jgi:hypothetical protein
MGVTANLRLSVALLLLIVGGGASQPAFASAQVVWQDLVFTGGLSVEGYWGNLPAITVTAVDSTEEASAVVGEFGIRGSVALLNRENRTLSLQFDSGLRQFVAGGFLVKAYAPKELVGRVDLSYREQAGSLGEVWFFGGLGARKVDDRPPMPLFIQPGYGTVDGRVRLQLYPINGVYYDAQVFAELEDYGTTRLTPQLALLDRRMLGLEVGATWGMDWTIRTYMGFRASEYQNQGTFDPTDPLRRDKALNLGATWTLRSSFFAQVGFEGTLNRSNSSRPEYNALSVRAVVSVPMPQEISLSFFADLAAKEYLTKTEFAQLVPGEEADNASVVYLEASRPLFMNLDGAVRFGWTRAETDIGNSYFERFGASFLFRYRPWE